MALVRRVGDTGKVTPLCKEEPAIRHNAGKGPEVGLEGGGARWAWPPAGAGPESQLEERILPLWVGPALWAGPRHRGGA
jgi:hypothetical protein